MAKKTIAVGDPVLFFGMGLTVVEILDSTDPATGETHRLARVADLAGYAKREETYAKIRALRAEQVALNKHQMERHAEIHAEVTALDKTIEALPQARLRLDLLSYWPEREVWVSEGRILNTAQLEKFEALTGRKPLPEAQRDALKVVEALGV